MWPITIRSCHNFAYAMSRRDKSTILICLDDWNKNESKWKISRDFNYELINPLWTAPRCSICWGLITIVPLSADHAYWQGRLGLLRANSAVSKSYICPSSLQWCHISVTVSQTRLFVHVKEITKATFGSLWGESINDSLHKGPEIPKTIPYHDVFMANVEGSRRPIQYIILLHQFNDNIRQKHTVKSLISDAP